MHLDYRERERIALFETEHTPERLAIASCSVRVYDVVRVLARLRTVASRQERRVRGRLDPDQRQDFALLWLPPSLAHEHY